MMSADALNFEVDIRRLITAGDLEGALAFIRHIVDHIRHDPATVGEVVTSPALDRLCAEIGAVTLSQRRAKGNKDQASSKRAEVIILATELYAAGGHTRVIEDIVRARPDKRHLILLTDFFGNGAPYVPKLDAEVRVARAESRLDKLRWVQDELARHPDAEVQVFNHHADACAVAAIQPGLNRDVIFFHHADHHLCLGARLQWPRHADFFAPYHRRCCNNGLHAEYWPLSVPDRSVRPDAVESFRREGKLVTCTSGVWTKFNPVYPFHYWEELPGILRTGGGTHVHIGDIPAELLVAMREHLAHHDIAPERFIHIPRVSSVWDTLIEHRVDLYMASFPIGGGRALIEALGAGVPILNHRHPLDPMLGTCGMGPADSLWWSVPAELQAVLSNLTAPDLARRSRDAREHYLHYHNPQIFTSCLRDGVTITPPTLQYWANDDLSAYLMRSLVREESHAPVFVELQKRLGTLPAAAHVTASTSADASLPYGIALYEAGQLEEAYTCFNALLEQGATEPELFIYLGLIASKASLPDDAAVFFERAAEVSGAPASVHAMIGQLSLAAGELSMADHYLSRALQDDPQLTGIHALLADTWQRQGRSDEALQLLRARLKPGHDADPEILSRAIALAKELGNVDTEYSLCMQAAQYPDCHSRAISLMNHLSDTTPAALLTEVRRFAAAFTNPTANALPFGRRERLCIGFVVGLLAHDDISQRLEPLLCQLDPERFETVLLFDDVTDEALAQRLSLIVDRSHSLSGLDAAGAAQLIRQLQIDALVNLDLHDNLGTLLVFAERAAPLQINWSQPPRPSGLANMDYVLVSANGQASDFSEKLATLSVTEPNNEAFAKAFGEALAALWQQRGGSLGAKR